MEVIFFNNVIVFNSLLLRNHIWVLFNVIFIKTLTYYEFFDIKTYYEFRNLNKQMSQVSTFPYEKKKKTKNII